MKGSFKVRNRSEFDRAMKWYESKGYEWNSGSDPSDYVPDCVKDGKPCEIEIVSNGRIMYDNHPDESLVGFDTFDRSDYEFIKPLGDGVYFTDGVPEGFHIRSIQYNPDKRATAVIFSDGDVRVVRRSWGQDDDIYFAVASAVAEKVYGSNSAFKRIIDEKATMIRKKRRDHDVK